MLFRSDLRQKAEATMIAGRGLMAENPLAAAQMLLALEFHLGPVQEIAIIGDPANEETKRVLRVFRKSFRPNQVLALRKPDADDGGIALLKDKSAQGAVTTYICQNFACQAPLVGAEAVERHLHSM